MDGRTTRIPAATLLLAALALTAGLSAAELPPARAQPVLDVRQNLPDTIAAGESVPIDIVVRNVGAAPADAVTLRSTLAPGLDLTDATPVPERLPGGLLWALGALAPGQQRLIRLRVVPRAGTPLREVRSSVQVAFQSTIDSTAVAQVRRPELDLAVSGPETALVGEPATFQILVRNRGTAPAPGVVLETLLPPGLAHPAGNDLENDLGLLAPGEVRQVVLRVTPTAAGDLVQRLRVGAEGEQPVERQAPLHVPDLNLRLEVNGPRQLVEGWPASYELTLHNEGAEVVAQARLTAVLPPGFTFAGADAHAVYVTDTHSLAWDLGDLRPGETRTLLWHGIARGSGEQACEAAVTSGTRACKRLTWKVTVAQAPPAPLSLPAPGAGPALPDLTAPPPSVPPTRTPPLPAPAVNGPESTAPAASPQVVAPAETPAPTHPAAEVAAAAGQVVPVWRPSRQLLQSAPSRGGSPSAAP
jgi:uncharacterized repeat protein (TIGR01451 family)